MPLHFLLLSRIQFGFTISFHIIFTSFTIGLAAWLTVLEALHLAGPASLNTRLHPREEQAHDPMRTVMDGR